MQKSHKGILLGYAVFWIILLIIILIVGDVQLAFSLNANPDSEIYTKMIKLYTDTLYAAIGISGIGTILTFIIPALKPYRSWFLTSIITYALTFGITATTKAIIKRQRPYVKYPEEINSFGKTEDDFSMPSGHTAYSSAISVSFAMKAKKVIVIVLFCLYNVLMMYTRLYLGLHWTSDVLVGSILGVGMAFAVGYIMDYLYKKEKMTQTVEIILAVLAIAVTIITGIL